MTAVDTRDVTLRDVASELRAFADTIDGMDEDDAQRETALVEMSRAAVTSRAKVDAFVQFLRRLESEREFLATEIERLTARRARLAQLSGKLEDYAVRALEDNGLRRFEGNASTLSLRKKPDTVLLNDDAAVPSEFKTLVITVPAAAWEAHVQWAATVDPEVEAVGSLLGAMRSPAECKIDRRGLLAALKAGREIPGADLRWGDNGLQIK